MTTNCNGKTDKIATHESLQTIYPTAILLQGILEVRVFKAEIRLDSRAPSSLVIEVNVRPLFVLVSGDLGFLVALEPSHVLLVETPALLLEFTRRKILLVGSLRIVEDKEKSIGPKLFKYLGVLKNR